jgi:beta-lactamase regulating signal transducer with metallopeptidase domain
VPVLMLTPALPRPSIEPLRVMLSAAGGPASAGLPTMPVPPVDTSARWLMLWLSGTLAVLAVQAVRQRRLTRLGSNLPAGSSPALVGLLRPRVALPMDFEQRFSPQERELILAHEAVHLARLDNLWNLLATLLTALHWWNPLAWWAARRMQADQELACDAAVLLHRPDATAAYTRALLAAHELAAPSAPLASRWGSDHPLIERIAMLNRPQALTRRRLALLGLALMGSAGIAWAVQTTTAAVPSTQRVYIKMDVNLGGKVTKPGLITLLGVPATIGIDHGDGSGHWEVVMTVSQRADGRLVVHTERSFGHTLRGEPLKKLDGYHDQIGAPDTPLELTWPAPDGSPPLVMNRVVSLVAADFRPK